MLNQEQELLLELLIKKYGKPYAQNVEKRFTTVNKQQKKYKAQLNRKRWTEDDLRVLAVMHSEGKSQTVIARRLRRSKLAVQTMISHMFGDNKRQVAIVKQFWQNYNDQLQLK